MLVVWVSESYKGVRNAVDANGRTEAGSGLDLFDVVVKGQIFGADGTRIGTELSLSSSSLVAANPVVPGMKEGFTVAWSGRPNHSLSDSERNENWDVYARQFALGGSPRQAEFRVNTFTYGDQFRPQICNQDGINFVLWTTLKQDGSWEGVVGRLISDGAQFLSKEFRVNTTTVGKQLFPAVSANSNHSFLAVWSSFVGGISSFDLLAQRYASAPEQGLAAPGAPYVSAISQTRLSVTWSALAGYTGVKYELYVDESTSPIVVENNATVVTSLAPNSTHGFRLAYVLTDGRKSPLSTAGTGKTWSEDDNFDALPDDWQSQFWGANVASWPSAASDSDGDGATNLQELLAGTDPSDSESVLRVKMTPTTQGPRLEWNTEAGCIYQVQVQAETQAWISVGTPRFAAGGTDSIPVDSGKVMAIYRVIRLR